MENIRDTISREQVSLTGMSRSEQFKSRADDFIRGVMSRQSDARALVVSSSGDLPNVLSGGTDLPSRGFIPVVAASSSPNQSGDSGGNKLEDIIVVLNGTAYYTNIMTDGRLDPVP